MTSLACRYANTISFFTESTNVVTSSLAPQFLQITMPVSPYVVFLTSFINPRLPHPEHSNSGRAFTSFWFVILNFINCLLWDGLMLDLAASQALCHQVQCEALEAVP